MLPEELADLTADDLQMLLSGPGGVITLDNFRAVAKFADERGAETKASDPDRLTEFEELVRIANSLISCPLSSILCVE